MDVEQVLAFLNEMQRQAPRRESNKVELTYEQKYLLKLVDIPNAPEKYFTQLGASLIDTLYREYPKSVRTFEPNRDRKFFLVLYYDSYSES